MATKHSTRTTAKSTEQEVVKESMQETVQPKKRQLSRDDLITVMNNTAGTFIYQSRRTGREWLFTEYGQTDEIELGELITINNSHPRILKEPWLLVLDEDAIEYLGLKRLYENVLNPEELDRFFSMSVDKMEQLLDKMPRGMKELIVGIAREKIKTGEFDSMAKIRLIEDKLKVNLRLE